MNDSLLRLFEWKAALGEAALQATLGILVVLAAGSLLPRLSGTTRSWLWRLAFGRVLLALFWSAPLTLPALYPISHTVSLATPPDTATQVVAPDVEPRRPASPRAPLDAGGVAAVLWLAGAAWCVGNGTRQLRHARQLLQGTRPVTDPQLLDCWEELLNSFGMWRAPELRESDQLDSPILLQITRPTVVLPVGLVEHWSMEQIRMMLAHELAHVRRRDLLWGWLPALTHTLLFFHPLVWIGSREWRLAHDSAADELALRVTGAPASHYARLLVRLAGSRGHAPAGLALMDARDSARTLERRLKLMSSRRTSNPTGRLSWQWSALLLGVAIAVPVRVTAQSSTPSAPRPGASPAVKAAQGWLQTDGRRDPWMGAKRMWAETLVEDRKPGAATSRTTPAGKSDGESPDRRRLREVDQELRALKMELDQVIRRNQELEAIRRQLDQEIRSLRARQGERRSKALPAPRGEYSDRLREQDELRKQESDLVAAQARLEALEELDRARKALQEAQARVGASNNRVPAERTPVISPAGRATEFNIRLLRNDGLDEKILAAVRLIALEGQWATLQLPMGKVVTQGEAANLPRGSEYVCVRVVREDGKRLLQIEWPAGDVHKSHSASPGQPVRFEPDQEHREALSPQSPNVIEVSVQPQAGR